jgi:toxin secretion/phage lysis holin
MEFNAGSIFKTIVALGGGAVSYLFGGWSPLLGILLAFVVIDYITGFVAAGIEGKLASEVGLKGIAKKVFIFVMVAVAHLADQAIGPETLPILIRDAAIFFYLANELLSIIENSGRIGLPVPPIIVKAVELLKNKSEVHHEVNKE